MAKCTNCGRFCKEGNDSKEQSDSKEGNDKQEQSDKKEQSGCKGYNKTSSTEANSKCCSKEKTNGEEKDCDNDCVCEVDLDDIFGYIDELEYAVMVAGDRIEELEEENRIIRKELGRSDNRVCTAMIEKNILDRKISQLENDIDKKNNSIYVLSLILLVSAIATIFYIFR